MITKFLLCREKFCVISYEIEICPMLHFVVNFGNICPFAVIEFIKQSFISLQSIIFKDNCILNL